jgi:hypothetical protein
MRNALLAACRARISSWLAALLTLLSGGAMTAAGYLLRTLGWATAGLVMIPGGVLILVALRLAQRRQPTTRDGVAQTPAVSGIRAATQLLANLSLPLRSQFVILGLTMASGAVMVLAGYAWAAQSWIWAATLAAVGGLFISGAFARAAAPRRDRYGRRQDGVIT